MSTADKQVIETDVAIVGGGVAGLTAAVTAGGAGTRVVVLEKRSILGGNGNIFGKEIPAAESPVQKREMHDVTKEACFKKAMMYSRYDCDGRIVRTIIDGSGDAIGWLQDKGVEFDMVRIHRYEDLVMHHKTRTVTGEVAGGEKIINALVKECEEYGVQLHVDTPVKRILVGPTGDVAGVLAVTSDGREVEVRARAVIVATGGYSGNRELLKLNPIYRDHMLNCGLPYDGDGIAMTTEIGADTEGLGELAIWGPSPSSGRDVARDEVGVPRLSLEVGGKVQELPWIPVVQEPYQVWLNKEGRRFVDEDIGTNHYISGIALARQTDGMSFTVFDSSILERMCKEGFHIGLHHHIAEWYAQRNGNIVGLDRELQRLATEHPDTAKISTSWDEIAQWIGVPSEVLKTTIDEYNAVCADGYDPVFGKERRWLWPLHKPPYYAIKCHCGILHTMGGIKINEHMQVIDKQSHPIPGLYAAGNETGGWAKAHAQWMLAGMTVALVGGRIAGANASQYASA